MQRGDYESALALTKTLSRHRLEGLRKACLRELRVRYKKSRKRKYGNLNKGFTVEELSIFFAHVRSARALMAFRIMAYAGLRVGEAIKVNLRDIAWRDRRLYVHTEKAGTGDWVPLHETLLLWLQAWVTERKEEILAHDGYLLYNGQKGRLCPYMGAGTLRTLFRRTIIACDMDMVYGSSDERGRVTRKLHRFSTHSLRHYFVTQIYRASHNIKVAQQLARHTDMGTTQTYIHTDQEELVNAVELAFVKSGGQ